PQKSPPVLIAPAVRWVLTVALAAVFAWAGAAKLVDRAGTAASFRALRVPTPAVTAVAVPIVELAIAAVLVIVPTAGAIAAIVALAGFSALLAVRIRAGTTAPCRCFGAVSTQPLGWVAVARNGALAAVALAVLAAHAG
ncbi:MAG: MauE/DoxX family redox-associated membrane protein, partial [Acidimicrobiales bacterium]